MHGRRTFETSIRLGTAVTDEIERGQPGQWPRNIFRQPAALETFRVGRGEDAPLNADSSVRDRTAVHRRLAALSERMARSQDDHVWLQGVERAGTSALIWENPFVPSGYTYLLQLIAHDLIDSVPHVKIAGEAVSPSFRNARLAPLMLDTIYGSGPDEAPHAYEVSVRSRRTSGAVPRTRLRLASLRDSGERAPGLHCPMQDIARAPRWYPSGVQSEHVEGGLRDTVEWPAPWLSEPLIADPRNDAHAFMSQLTVLFHQLHNKVMHAIETRHPMPDGHTAGQGEAEIVHLRYLCARAVVTLIYRKIIEVDLLQRILHPKVYQAYTGQAPFALDGDRGKLSLEFTHGALRFGHAMVRDEYRVNTASVQNMMDGLALTSRQGPLFSGVHVPLGVDWAVDWGQFFELGEPPNFSRRISPSLPEALTNATQWNPKTSDDFRGLAHRDFKSASYAGLWSVRGLHEHLRSPSVRDKMAGTALEGVVPDYEEWTGPLRRWLDDSVVHEEGFSSVPIRPHLDDLCEDPPLPFFILFEAAHEIQEGQPLMSLRRDGRIRIPGQAGCRLGPLGSIIVAETMFGALRSEPFGFKEVGVSVRDNIGRCCRALLGDKDLLADVIREDIDTMPKLLAWIFSSTPNR